MVNLPKHLENVRQHVLWNAGAVVSNADQRFVDLSTCGYPDRSIRTCILGGIVEKITKHLRQSDRIAVNRNGFVWQRHNHMLTARFNVRLNWLNRSLQQGVEVHWLLVQFDLAAG